VRQISMQGIEVVAYNSIARQYFSTVSGFAPLVRLHLSNPVSEETGLKVLHIDGNYK